MHCGGRYRRHAGRVVRRGVGRVVVMMRNCDTLVVIPVLSASSNNNDRCDGAGH